MSIKRFFSIKKIIFIFLIISWIVCAVCFGDFINHTELGAMIFIGIFTGICYIAISSLIKRLKYLTDKLTARQITVERELNGALFLGDDTFYVEGGKAEVTWGSVVLSLLVLPPLGIFYLIRKAVQEKSKYYLNGVKMKVMGSVFMIATALPILILTMGEGKISTKIAVIALPGFYALLGLSIFIIGYVFEKKGKTNEGYLSAIFLDKETRLDVLAKRQNATYSQAVDTINKLIDNGYMQGYIYHADREVIVPGISKKIAFKCYNCGGTTVLYSNDERVCVYCGAKAYDGE